MIEYKIINENTNYIRFQCYIITQHTLESNMDIWMSTYSKVNPGKEWTGRKPKTQTKNTVTDLENAFKGNEIDRDHQSKQ